MNSSNNSSSYDHANFQPPYTQTSHSSFDPYKNYQSPSSSFQSSNYPNDMNFVGSQPQKQQDSFNNPPSNYNNPPPAFPSTLNTLTPENLQAAKERKVSQGRRLTFEEFIAQKVPAFFYFSKHPDTAELFVRSDVDELTKLSSTYNKTLSGLYFAACGLTFFADYWLRYKSLIYGMTYRSSILKLLVKYWLIPSGVTGLVSGAFLDDMYQPKMERIASKYNYAESIFRNAYNKGDIPKNFKSGENNQNQNQMSSFPGLINSNKPQQ